jgi:hypothetical protein
MVGVGLDERRWCWAARSGERPAGPTLGLFLEHLISCATGQHHFNDYTVHQYNAAAVQSRRRTAGHIALTGLLEAAVIAKQRIALEADECSCCRHC